MLKLNSCLPFLCFTRHHVLCFYALSDFIVGFFLKCYSDQFKDWFFTKHVHIFYAYLFYTYTIVICNFSILCLMTTMILGWGEYVFQGVEIKLMPFVFMLFKTSCLLFLCSTRLHVFCFDTLQDFMSSIFMLYETSLLHFFKNVVLINLRIDSLESMFIFF